MSVVTAWPPHQQGAAYLARRVGDLDLFKTGMASRKRSAVWLYYQPGEDASKVVCMICLDAIQHCGNTSNMLKHLRSKHHAEYADVEAKKKAEARTPREAAHVVPAASSAAAAYPGGEPLCRWGRRSAEPRVAPTAGRVRIGSVSSSVAADVGSSCLYVYLPSGNYASFTWFKT